MNEIIKKLWDLFSAGYTCFKCIDPIDIFVTLDCNKEIHLFNPKLDEIFSETITYIKVDEHKYFIMKGDYKYEYIIDIEKNK